MEKITFTLDGDLIEVDAGTTILQAAQSRGIEIPSLCHHEALTPRGSCRICSVEVDGQKDLLPSCMTEIVPGMVVRTSTSKVLKARRTSIELLLSFHLGDCISPCTAACPASVDNPNLIKQLRKADYHAALDVIVQAVPFPGIIGRICKRPCEDACRRRNIDEAVALCQIKRSLADAMAKDAPDYIPQKSNPSGKKVAVVGAGPAGLAAAFYLQLMGHQCTLYDAQDKPGGLLRFGMPSFRLPEEVLDREICLVEKLGVIFKGNQRLGRDITLTELRLSYDAIFLALGAWRAATIDGIEKGTDGVALGLDFLLQQNRAMGHKALTGKRIVVVGGGDVALDAARLALRQGAQKVSLFCLESREEMPARRYEIQAAEEEGMTLHPKWGLQRLISEKGHLSALECIGCDSVISEGGEFSPKYNQQKILVPCDLVVLAIGQKVDPQGTEDVDKGPGDKLAVDKHTLETSLPGVFAGGDCVTGPNSATAAMAAGKRAAISINQFLHGQVVVGEALVYQHSLVNHEEALRGLLANAKKMPRISASRLDGKRRARTFDEIEQGLNKAQMLAEAERCLACACHKMSTCKLRAYATAIEANGDWFTGGQLPEYTCDDSHVWVTFSSHKCIGCRTCVRLSAELLDKPAIQISGRGIASRIQPDFTQLSREEIVKIAKSCPVGAMELKPERSQTMAKTDGTATSQLVETKTTTEETSRQKC